VLLPALGQLSIASELQLGGGLASHPRQRGFSEV
jgi:hypothetical protein